MNRFIKTIAVTILLLIGGVLLVSTAYKAGSETGYSNGYKEGLEEGYTYGFEDGEVVGYRQGEELGLFMVCLADCESRGDTQQELLECLNERCWKK